jgi:RimJ/RimL family protein N-acetyltransferase
MKVLINDRAMDKPLGKWVCEKVDPEWHDGNISVGVLRDGRPVAAVMFSDFNGANVHAHLRCEDAYGMSRSFICAVFNTAFRGIRAQRVTAACAASNSRIVTVLKKMGFQMEAVLREFLPDGDIYIFVMRPDHCRYLEVHHG